MISIVDLIPDEILEKNIYPRIRTDNRCLIDKDYDVKLTQTTSGTNQYPCFKLTFGNHKMVQNGGFLEIVLLSEILAMRVVANSPFNGRVLSFERSSNPKNGGSYGAKVSCDAEMFAHLKSYEGTHKLHKKQNSEWFYIYPKK